MSALSPGEQALTMNEPQQADGARSRVRRDDNESHSEPAEAAAGTDVERFSVVVIGGGQAGLAAGYHLAQRGIEFVILEKASRLGESWRRQWDPLRLFTPARYDGLPGMAFPRRRANVPHRKSRWRTICRSTQNDSACRSASGSRFLA